ncbi:hypothetical protein HW555_001109 [Spodoptera exigua]|uniref:Uncharacterized protein n=1 Tax=Spodoptera exigua TaxID=7107 RepID=A0A835GTR6_SPOEX|nr:hypothetical protein HW555_001109 [Spodoptera exigua]
MKLTMVFVMLMAVLALFAGGVSSAPNPDPKVNFQALKKVGKTVKKVFGAVSAAATAHELYQSAKNRGQQG